MDVSKLRSSACIGMQSFSTEIWRHLLTNDMQTFRVEIITAHEKEKKQLHDRCNNSK